MADQRHVRPSGGTTAEALWTSGLAGLTAFIWYALPDYVVSKRRRALAKSVLFLPPALYGASKGREIAREDPRALRDGSAGTPDVLDDSVRGDLVRASSRAATGRTTQQLVPGQEPTDAQWQLPPGTVVGFLAGGVVTAAVLAAERLTYETGEWFASRGLSHPHTKIGAVLGAAVALVRVARSADR